MDEPSINIRMSGPGGTMGVPVTYLKRALEDLGYEVILEDNYNEDYVWVDDVCDMVRNRGCFVKGSKSGIARITTESFPWGG